MSKSSRARRASRHAHYRPQLEMLETRTMPDAGFGALTTNADLSASDHILVQFEPNFSLSGLPIGAGLREQLPMLPNFYSVNVPSGWTVSQLLAGLQNNPNVRFAQPDYQVSISATPNDPGFSSQWGLNNTSVPGADIGAPAAWNVTTGTGSVIVAVIDTGVDYTHPDLAANMWRNSGEIPGNGSDDDHDGFVDDVYGWDFANNDADPMDDHSHGTHVAGIIGAVGNNGIGVSGVAWNVKIMALKFLSASGSGSTSNAIKALDFAVSHGAAISNNSWGGGGVNNALSDAIRSARNAGHIFVAAAGNSGSNNDSTPFYPASYNLANVVAVAASDNSDNLAGFSNYGASTVDLAAPGTGIYATLPVSMGSYGYKSGTSMAAPFVAGALAVVRDLHPTWSYSQVIDQVLNNVDPLPSLSGKVATGGRLNLARAVGASSSTPPSLIIGNVSVNEGNSGTTGANFTVNLSAPSSSSVTVNWATANGSASAGSDYAAASGTLTFAPGETSKAITVTVYGDTQVEGNETFFVNLSGASGATISAGQGTGTILNDDTAVVVTIAIGNASVNEGNSGTTNAAFTVTLSQASSSSVSVNWATADGSAGAGSDYAAASGTLTFAPGETSKTITVTVYGDTQVEGNETFFVNLSGASGATISAGQGTGTILNDDTASTPVTIAIGDVSIVEGNSGITYAVFSVSLSSASGSGVSVNYATSDGTATSASGDYVFAGGTLAFAPGETSKTISVAINGDTLTEAHETFFVNLSNPSGATIADGQAQGLIGNDDTAVSINNVAAMEGLKGATFVTMSLTLSQASALPVTVRYATANGTASSKNDYFAASGTVTFEPGETSKTITIKIKGDKNKEADEYFFVRLSAPTNTALAVAEGIVTILNDDGTTPATRATTAFEYDPIFGKWLRLSPKSHSPAAAYWSTLANASSGSSVVLPNGTNVWVNAVGKDLLFGDPAPPNNAPLISIANVSVLEGDSGFTLVTMTLTLSQASDETVSVKYATRNGTAKRGSDYLAGRGTVTFDPGETSQTITLKIRGNQRRERDEFFFVNLGAAKNARYGVKQAIVTILNDDGATPPYRSTIAFEYDAIFGKWIRLSPKSHNSTAAHWSSLADAANGSSVVLPNGANVWLSGLGTDLLGNN